MGKHPSRQHALVLDQGVLILTQCVEDKNKYDQTEEDDIELLESRKDATQYLRLPEQAFEATRMVIPTRPLYPLNPSPRLRPRTMAVTCRLDINIVSELRHPGLH